MEINPILFILLVILFIGAFLWIITDQCNKYFGNSAVTRVLPLSQTKQQPLTQTKQQSITQMEQQPLPLPPSSTFPRRVATEEDTNTPRTRQIYKKGDEIVLPSSLSGPYIGRDQICFRTKLGDTDFMGARSGCMACQVDTRANHKTYDNTKTNVMSTCVYGSSGTPNVFTKEQCVKQCSTVKDLV